MFNFIAGMHPYEFCGAPQLFGISWMLLRYQVSNPVTSAIRSSLKQTKRRVVTREWDVSEVIRPYVVSLLMDVRMAYLRCIAYLEHRREASRLRCSSFDSAWTDGLPETLAHLSNKVGMASSLVVIVFDRKRTRYLGVVTSQKV